MRIRTFSVIKPRQHQPFSSIRHQGFAVITVCAKAEPSKAKYRSREFWQLLRSKVASMAGNEAGKPRVQMPNFEFIDKNVNR